MKQPSKLLCGPRDGMGVLRALCIDKVGHVASISFCHNVIYQN